MPDDSMKFMDSPWVQLGVPLAATVASSIAPRHMGNASRMGLASLQGINNYRRGQKTLAAHAAALQKQEQETADFDSMIDNLTENDTPEEKDPMAPEGGETPQADMNARTQALEAGKTPSPTFHPLKKDEAFVMKRLSHFARPQAAKMLEDRVSTYEQNRAGMRLSDAAHMPLLPAGGRVTDIPVQGGGKFSMEGPSASPHFETGVEGGRKIATGVPNAPGKYDIGEAGAEHEAKPEMRVIRKGDSHVAVFFTPNGIQKEVVLGHLADAPDDILKNFSAKVYMRAIGKPSGDEQFDSQINKQEAEELLKKMQTQNLASVLASAIAGGGAPPAQ